MIAIPDGPCPFVVGQEVYYRPSSQGLGHDSNIPDELKLVPGKKYKIGRIIDERYIYPEDSNYPREGLYWTEFSVI